MKYNSRITMKILFFLLVQIFLISNIAQADFSRDVPSKMPVSHFQNRTFRKPLISDDINIKVKRSEMPEIPFQNRTFRPTIRKMGIIGTGVKVATKVVKKFVPKSVIAKSLIKIIRVGSETQSMIGFALAGGAVVIKKTSALKDFLFDKEGNIPDIKKDGSVVQNHTTSSGGTLEFIGSLHNDEISITEKNSNGDLLNNDTFFANVELSREELSNKYLEKIDKPLNIEVSKQDLEDLKQNLADLKGDFEDLKGDVEDLKGDVLSEEELEEELYRNAKETPIENLDVVTEEELEKELYRNAEETPIENLDIVTEEELEKEIDTNAEEIPTVEEEVIDSKINTSSDIFKDINTEISIPRTNFPIGLKPTSISIPIKNYIEVDMNEYNLNNEDIWDSQMRDIPSIYTPMTYDDWAYPSLSDSYGFDSGSSFGSGGWGFGWSW
ncbi:hypothetical protein AB834_00130 [PVC group bacterium (ex Bugula neritina AB1)]|nr:hypothetical protein AB834_00130 [PVC group bacterium (ex Bugula neritina AB1)]